MILYGLTHVNLLRLTGLTHWLTGYQQGYRVTSYLVSYHVFLVLLPGLGLFSVTAKQISKSEKQKHSGVLKVRLRTGMSLSLPSVGQRKSSGQFRFTGWGKTIKPH